MICLQALVTLRDVVTAQNHPLKIIHNRRNASRGSTVIGTCPYKQKPVSRLDIEKRAVHY
jgi:hypothetical protein